MSGDSTDPTNRIYRSWARPRKVEVNASGPAASAYPASGIHDGDANLLYADGHVDTVDLAMYDPANDEIPVTNSEWFRYWSLESQ
jgi:prepilin-type processing-associated H-X9-DG protein